MIDFNDLSNEVFQILRAYGKDMVLYDTDGTRVFEPSEARRIYVNSDNILVSILDDGDNSSIKLYLSPSLNLNQVQGLLLTIRRLATMSNLLFHVKKFNKEIKPKDFATQASVTEGKQMDIMEGLYGTSKSSYLKLENARMIVRHGARIKEHVIGDRGRNINSIFIENAQGERQLFPVTMLSGARAMTQHVSNGGTFADAVGSQIIRMAQDFRNLATVATHVQDSLSEAATAKPKIEAYGRKGMKNTTWRKTFTSVAAMEKWCETNDATVEGQREEDMPAKTKTDEDLLSLRTGIFEEMRSCKRSFARMYNESTYVSESAVILNSMSLMEGSTALAESIEKFTALLGEGVDPEAMNSLARLVPVSVLSSDTMMNEEMEDESFDNEIEEDFAIGPQVDDPIEVTATGRYQGQVGTIVHVPSDVETGFFVVEIDGVQRQTRMSSFKLLTTEAPKETTIDVCVDGSNGTACPNNKVMKEFDNWVESFDPANMFATNEADESNKFVVYGKLGLNNSFRKSFDTEEDRDAWMEKNRNNERLSVEGTEDPVKAVSEGKSFKRNDDDDTDAETKKKDDKEKRDAAKNKKTPVTESMKMSDDVAAGKIAAKLKGMPNLNIATITQQVTKYLGMVGKAPTDVKYLAMLVHDQLSEAGLAEGKSFKRNKDDDVDAKKKEDKEKRDAKKQPVEETFRVGSKGYQQVARIASSNIDRGADEKQKAKNEKDKADAAADKTIDEASTGPWEVSGTVASTISGKAVPFKKSFGSKEARTEWLATHDAKISNVKVVDPAYALELGEGKSYKRNGDDSDDAQVAKKRKEDKEKRDAKKQPVSEGAVKGLIDNVTEAGWYAFDSKGVVVEGPKDSKSDISAKYRDKDGSEFSVMKISEADLEKDLDEGKSYKRNKDEDADAKKKEDKEKRDNKKQPVDENLVEAKVEKKYCITKEKSGKEYKQTGTLAELIQCYKYTLETGESYQSEKGNKKINTNPSNIKSLVSNLNNAVNNAASNGYAGVYYSATEVTGDAKVEEGKSFKRNKDDDVDAKKKEDKEKRDSKKQPVSETSTYRKKMDAHHQRANALYGFPSDVKSDDDSTALTTVVCPEDEIVDEARRPRKSEQSCPATVSTIDEDDIEVTVTYNVFPGDKGSWEDPPTPAEVEILTVCRDDTGEDIINILDQDTIDSLENKAYESIDSNFDDYDEPERDRGYMFDSVDCDLAEDEGGELKVGDKVQPHSHPDGEPFEVIRIVDSEQVEVKDDYGNTGVMMNSDLFKVVDESEDVIPRNQNDSFIDDVVVGGIDGEEQSIGYTDRLKKLAGLK